MKRFYTNIPVNKKPRRKTSIKLTAFMLAALCLMFVLKYATGANSGLEYAAALHICAYKKIPPSSDIPGGCSALFAAAYFKVEANLRQRTKGVNMLREGGARLA